MYEAILIAGAIIASAILIFLGLRRDDKETRIRMMARTLVRAVEKRSEWDTTIRSDADKWARIVLVLQAEFDVDDDWLHIIIGEAQFDMEADYGHGSKDIGTLVDRHSAIGDERQNLADREYHIGDLEQTRTRSGWDSEESPGLTELDDLGENLPIPSAE